MIRALRGFTKTPPTRNRSGGIRRTELTTGYHPTT